MPSVTMSPDPNVGHWPTVRLSDGLISGIQPGFACGNHNRTGDGIIHVRPFNVTTEGDMDFSSVKHIPSSEADRPERQLASGDVVFNNTNSPELVGKTALYQESEPMAFSNHMTRIRVNPDRLRPEYLALALHQLWREGYFTDKCNNHVSQASISRAVLLESEILLPSLEVQDELVSDFRQAKGEIDRARTRLATIPALLRKFRQSVLAAAYDCSILLPLGETIVTECSLGDIIRKIEAGKSFKAEGHPPRNGVPGVIKVSAMTWGRFNPLESKQLIPGTKPNPATEIHSGDLLFSRANTEELVGASVLVEATPPNLFLSDKSLRLVPVERICKRWLNAALSSPQVRDHFAEIATGTSNSMRNISQSKLLRTPVLLPEFEDQKRIADRVESLFALADSIESRLADATAQVERTTQAILAKAFRGEL